VATIKPFCALRPTQNEAAQVASVPYDVVSITEARKIAEKSQHSFLRVTRAEIDLPDNTNVYAPEVYAQAKKNLEKLQIEGILLLEPRPSLYIYRLVKSNQTQTAVVALCSLDEYDNNLIKKHEKTRPEKEDDRTKHIIETKAQTGLIFLCYRGTSHIDETVSRTTTAAPLYDFVAEDGVEHTIWQVENGENLIQAFKEIPALYIADGHHRAASASRARAILREENNSGKGNHDFFVAALFPAEQLKILAYNRIVKDLNNLSDTEFLQKLSRDFSVVETNVHHPEKRKDFCMYLAGKWYKLCFTADFKHESVIDALDVSILQNYVFKSILGIEDARTDKRIDFVGGIRGAKELEKLVNDGAARAAFSLFPTSVEDLLVVSDRDEIMPPKSTWFEPKLRDGLLVHLI
jgi:uncharacterized protein (DUF1015 family)